MNSSIEIRVSYAKWVGILQIIASLLLFGFVVLLVVDGSFLSFAIVSYLLIASLFLWVGISILRKPYFILEDTQLVIFAPLYLAKKIYTFERLEEIKIIGQRVYVGSEKTKIAPWATNPNDWLLFVEAVEDGKKKSLDRA